MHIKNVTREDDSLDGKLGSYECHAFAVNDTDARARHGFSVNVISSKLCTVLVQLYIYMQSSYFKNYNSFVDETVQM